MTVKLDDPPPESANWDEAQLTASLARLEHLQDQVNPTSELLDAPKCTLLTYLQLDALRLVIPGIIKPLAQASAAPSDLFQTFKQAATGASASIRSFRTNWEDEETQRILGRASESVAANGDLSSASEVPRYGWLEAAVIKSEGLEVHAEEESIAQADMMEGRLTNDRPT